VVPVLRSRTGQYPICISRPLVLHIIGEAWTTAAVAALFLWPLACRPVGSRSFGRRAPIKDAKAGIILKQGCDHFRSAGGGPKAN
jgi:hypothetical protein